MDDEVVVEGGCGFGLGLAWAFIDLRTWKGQDMNILEYLKLIYLLADRKIT